MSGLIVALGLAMLAFCGLLFFVPQRKALWPALAAVLVLAMAGYVWQGSPAQSSAPARKMSNELELAESFLQMRSDMDTNYGVAKQWLVMADSYARDGNYRYAAAFIQAGLRQHPRNGDLWAGLGVVLLLASDGKMSPPAKMAFSNARTYGPLNRAPDYFEGLVELFEGSPLRTLQIWQRLVDGAPDKAIWKPKLESQLAGLKTMLQSVQSNDVSLSK